MTIHSEALLSLSKLISPAVDCNEVRDIVLSKSTPWIEIINYANQHLMIPILYSALEDKNLLSLVEDELIVEYLTTVYEFNRIRNESIMIQLQEICHLFSEIGVTPVLLKGAAALSEGYYPLIGARVMSDIDILVPENEIKKCIELLETKGGYKAVDNNAPLWLSHQYRRIYSENGISAVEIHYHALIQRCRSYLTDEELMEHVRPSINIENAYVIEPSFDLYHIFLHSEMQDLNHQNSTLSLRGLHHASVIAEACKDEIDWNALSTKCENHDLSSVFGDYLYMLNKLFKIEVPPKMLGSSTHFLNITNSIDMYNKIPPTMGQLFFKILKKSFSYKDLKYKYKLKNKIAYPFAIIRSLFDLLFKYTFSSRSRKRLLNYLENYLRSKQFGSR